MAHKEGPAGIEKFAQFFIRKIKDAPLDWLDMAMEKRESDYGLTEAHPLIQKLKTVDEETKNLIRAAVSSSIMTGMHDFLYALQCMYNDGDREIEVLVEGKSIAGLSEEGLNYDVFYWDEDYSAYLTSGKANEMKVGKKQN